MHNTLDHIARVNLQHPALWLKRKHDKEHNRRKHKVKQQRPRAEDHTHRVREETEGHGERQPTVWAQTQINY